MLAVVLEWAAGGYAEATREFHPAVFGDIEPRIRRPLSA